MILPLIILGILGLGATVAVVAAVKGGGAPLPLVELPHAIADGPFAAAYEVQAELNAKAQAAFDQANAKAKQAQAQPAASSGTFCAGNVGDKLVHEAAFGACMATPVGALPFGLGAKACTEAAGLATYGAKKLSGCI